jgi:isopentenyl diphosphate isomerase/L-lactate dehydrogenase-like FMN-dependent dehydrogenase
MPLTRREAIGRVLARRQAGAPGVRPVPRNELVNTLEFEEQAARRLPPEMRALVAGSPRASFDRITLRPRLCVPVLDLDLSVTLFGDTHFAPILVGPIEDQRRFHPEGERATVQGAGAAKTAVVVSSRSSVPIAALAGEARAPLWVQVFAGDPQAAAQAGAAVQAGCRIVCVTVSPAPAAADWTAVSAIARASSVPVIVKGIRTPDAARAAIARGARGLVVSSYRGPQGEEDSPILAVPDIVDAAGDVPVLVDGAFRRGTDILKALAFGARAVLVGRPVVWGLAAYGAEGVQTVLEMLQTDLARYMAMCGKPRLAEIDRSLLRVHARG